MASASTAARAASKLRAWTGTGVEEIGVEEIGVEAICVEATGVEERKRQ